MKTWVYRFNIYLFVLLLGLAVGCQTDKAKNEDGQTDPDKKAESKKKDKDKEGTAMRFYLEVNADGSDRNSPVTLFRANPVSVNINRQPFLTEIDIKKAEVIDEMGVPAIRVQFRFPTGARTLEMVTTAYKGQRIVVFSHFGQDRWLAAPQITQAITDGIFTFVPDTSPEEADRIVRGLNNLAKEVDKKS